MSDMLKALAAGQGGVLTGLQAQGIGFAKPEIQRLCKAGAWWAPRRGIYAPGPRPSDEAESRDRHAIEAAAALLAVGRDDAGVAATSAAWLWELDWLTLPKLDTVSLAWPPGGSVRKYPGLRVLSNGLPERHVTVGRAGLRICTPARTVVDLARTLEFREAVILTESAMRRYGVTGADLEGVLDDFVRWPGKLRAARVVDFVDGRTESVAESLARCVFAEIGLPAPGLQVKIGDAEGVFARVDFYFEKFRTIVEIDGKVKYYDPDEAFREKVREDRLREAGYEVVRFTWAELLGPPERVKAKILRAFARARAR